MFCLVGGCGATIDITYPPVGMIMEAFSLSIVGLCGDDVKVQAVLANLGLGMRERRSLADHGENKVVMRSALPIELLWQLFMIDALVSPNFERKVCQSISLPIGSN